MPTILGSGEHRYRVVEAWARCLQKLERVTAMLPAAPATFSMMTAWPRIGRIRSPR